MSFRASNEARRIIVETANRFARDLIVQETGWRYLQSLGIELIAADSPNAFLDDTPTADRWGALKRRAAKIDDELEALKGEFERRKLLSAVGSKFSVPQGRHQPSRPSAR